MVFNLSWPSVSNQKLLTILLIGHLLIGLAYMVLGVCIWTASRFKIIGPIMGTNIWYLLSLTILSCGTFHMMATLSDLIPQVEYEAFFLSTASLIAVLTTVLFSIRVVELLEEHRSQPLFELHEVIEHAPLSKLSSPNIERLKQILQEKNES